jgi:hypothetical protein
MTTIDAAAMGGACRGVRMLAPGWAATTAAATLGFRAWDGTSEILLGSGLTDHDFDTTATPAWAAKMVARTPIIWDQTALDALAFRVGFSSDASPAVGIHAIYAEVAFRIGDLVRVGEAEDGAFAVDFRIDPDSSAVIAIVITTPPGTRGAFFDWSILEVPQTQIYVVPNDVHTEVIGATDIATMTSYALTPDPVD